MYLFLGLQKGGPSYWRSRKPSKENIQPFQNLKFLDFFYFCGSFLPAWIRIGIRIPDQDSLA